MVSDKVVRSIFNQCKQQINPPYKIKFFTSKDAMQNDFDDTDLGGCEATERHGEYRIFVNPVAHEEDDIHEIKNSCIHELIHTFFIPSRSQAILGITNKEMLMYNHVHEKDVCTMSEALCKIIKVKEEEIIFKPLDK